MSGRIFFWGLSAGVLTFIGALVFKRIHEFSTYTDFSRVLSLPVLAGLSVGVCLLAALLFAGLTRWLGRRGEIAFNLLFSVLTFASITFSLAYILPLDMEFPELFPGLAVPMHFFPALAWYTLRPFFVADQPKR